MTTTLERLLKYPHAAVFDKTPAAELALRLRHPDGAVWRVADWVLTVSVGDNEWTYDLCDYTLASLAAALEADGFEVAYLSPAFASHGARVLVEGAGDQTKTNGDHLTAFTSPLWVLLGGYAEMIREAQYQSEQALRQMIITQAEGEWLDLWGMLYSEARLPGESDADYAERIPKEAFRIRVNKYAIEQAIKDRTGYDVEIREPWRLMFTLDISALSGDHHLPDDKFYSYFVIQPVSNEPIDWDETLAVIERNRPAGIQVYSPQTEFAGRHVTVQPPVEYLVAMAGLQLFAMANPAVTEVPLGIMRLDDNEIGMNHPVSIFILYTLANFDFLAMSGQVGDRLNIDLILNRSVLPAPLENIVSVRSVAYASIALSDGVPLGDENAILSRGRITYEAVPPETLSDELAPSDYVVVKRHERVERIVLSNHSADAEYPSDDVVADWDMASEGAIIVRYAKRELDNEWTGTWDNRKWYGEHVVMGMAMSSFEAGDILDENLYLDASIIGDLEAGDILDDNLYLDISTIE